MIRLEELFAHTDVYHAYRLNPGFDAGFHPDCFAVSASRLAATDAMKP
jgi:hypothetical protein